MTEKIYVQHSRINGGQWICLNDEEDVIDLTVKPDPCDFRSTRTIEIKAGGDGLKRIFSEINSNDSELIEIRIGQHSRMASKQWGVGDINTGRRQVALTLY